MLSFSSAEEIELEHFRTLVERCEYNAARGGTRPDLAIITNKMPPIMAALLTARVHDGGWQDTLKLTPDDISFISKKAKLSTREIMLLLLGLGTALAHTPHDSAKVAAVVEAGSGTLYVGLPIYWHSAHMKFSLHAVQTALLSAYGQGENRIKNLLVEVPPCVACRQFLRETISWPNIQQSVALNGYATLKSGQITDSLVSNKGLPKPVVIGGLMRKQKRRLVTRYHDNTLIAAACEAAEQSYAPYSRSFAGAAIRSRQNTIHKGSYIEIGVSVMSILAIEAAITNLILSGRDMLDIAEIVLVESRGKVSQFSVTQNLAQQLGDVPFEYVIATLD